MLSYLFTVAIGFFWSVSGVWTVERSLVECVKTVFWEEHPPGVRWAARIAVFGGSALQFDLHLKVWVRMRRLLSLTPDRRRPSKPSDRPASDPGSDVDDVGRQADALYMDLPSKLTVSSQQVCSDTVCEKAILVVEDHLASRLPSSDLREGLPLCRTHRGIYQTI